MSNILTITAGLLLWGSIITYSPWWTAPVCIALFFVGELLRKEDDKV